MSITAYVGQGSITIRAESMEALHKHMNSLGPEFEDPDFEAMCNNFGIEVNFDKEGGVSDAYPCASNWSDTHEGRFYQEIAPFVESGSYATFYCDGYLFAYIYRKGEVEEVSLDDIAKALAGELVGKCHAYTKSVPESKLSYQWPDPKVMEVVSPGDTVPLGLCPYCKTGVVYQIEEE